MPTDEKSSRSAVEEEFTDIVGGHGKWQMKMYFFCFLCSWPHCFHNLIMTFFAPNVDHWCARPPDMLAANISANEWRNQSIPLVVNRAGLIQKSQCTLYKSILVNGSLFVPSTSESAAESCKSWEYDDSFYKSTMVDDWDLVCDREWLISVSKTVYMVAFLIAATLCGQLSDKFGRRPVMIVCVCLFLIAGLLTLLSRNFMMFVVLRFFLAMGITSTYTISYVLLSEVVSVEYRSIYLFTFKFGWTYAYMLMPLIAWLIPSWFWLQCALTLPWLCLLSVFWMIPETPRWLLTHGKYTQLEKTLLIAAEKNGKDMKQAKASIHNYVSRQQKISKTEEKKRDETVFDLLKTPALRRSTLNIYFCWFVISYIYYALSWNTNDLGGDPYWTFFICGAVELPAGVIFLFLCRHIGHRMGLLIANVGAGICLIITIFIPADMVWWVIAFSMGGKFFSSGSFDIVYIYTAEIFPTVVRNVAVGSSSTFARIGALLAPFIRQLADVTHPVVPMALPGGLSVISGLLLLLLPKTIGQVLPDTLEEGELFARKEKVQKKSSATSEFVNTADVEMR
ncbi:organic cation transporter protein isoform X2 [Parasteatoda tepidariorum]|nr:organic cation transporter protein [Parasteatoda tepidariorum]XP_015930795.1 organic cation transporter protein [Parasteatoda tepidariorum]XP_042910882.1 organic cation transporter protein [Parasteatoda tepidariorum]